MKDLINNDGYRLIRNPTRSPKQPLFVLEHIYLIEQLLGRTLTTSEIVVHKNGDKLDNRPQNLEVQRQKRATRYKGTPASKTTLMCVWCSRPFERLTKHIRHESKTGRLFAPCCSAACRSRYALNQRKDVDNGTPQTR